MVKQPHQLEIVEYIALVGSIAGSVVAAISGNILYAATPLSVSVLLNLLNRRHMERLMRQSTNTAIARVQRKLTEEINTLQASQTPPDFSVTSVVSAADIQKLVTSLIEVNLNPLYQELVELQKQQNRLQDSVPKAMDYLNIAALSAKVEHLEEVATQLSENLVAVSHRVEASLQEQLNELEQQLQTMQRLGEAVNWQLNLKVEHVEQELAQLSESVDGVFQRVEGSVQHQLDDLKQQVQAVQHPEARRNWKLENKVKYLEQALVQLSEALAATKNQVRASVQSQLDQLKQQLRVMPQEGNDEVSQSSVTPAASNALCTAAPVPTALTNSPLSDEFLPLQRWSYLHDAILESKDASAKVAQTPVGKIAAHSDWVSAVVMSPDGQILFSGSFDRTIKRWNLQTGELLGVLSEGVGGVYAIALSADGKTLASGSADRQIKLWNLDADQPICTLWEYSGSVRSIAYSPSHSDRQRGVLASGNFDQTIKLWDLETRELLDTLKGHLGAVYAIAFSPNGQLLASGGADGLIKIWDWQQGELLHTLSGDLGSIGAIAWSPDGQLLASGSSDKTIKLWQVDTGQRLNTLVSHVGAITALTMSPDGETLVSGSVDATMRIWHVGTGQLLSVLSDAAGSSVLSIAMSPDGQAIVSGSTDGTIKIWRRDEV